MSFPFISLRTKLKILFIHSLRWIDQTVPNLAWTQGNVQCFTFLFYKVLQWWQHQGDRGRKSCYSRALSEWPCKIWGRNWSNILIYQVWPAQVPTSDILLASDNYVLHVHARCANTEQEAKRLAQHLLLIWLVVGPGASCSLVFCSAGICAESLLL